MIVIKKRRKKEKRKTKSFSTKNWYCIALSVPKIGIVSLFQYQILVLYRSFSTKFWYCIVFQYQILVLKLRNRHLPSFCRFLR